MVDDQALSSKINPDYSTFSMDQQHNNINMLKKPLILDSKTNAFLWKNTSSIAEMKLKKPKE